MTSPFENASRHEPVPLVGQPPQSAPVRFKNAGTVSLGFAGALALQMLSFQVLLYSSSRINIPIGVLAAGSQFVGILLALGAMGFGVAGLRNGSARPLGASAGLAIGAFTLLTTLGSVFVSVLL